MGSLRSKICMIAAVALVSAGGLAIGGSARADVFTLTNTRHDNCHTEFPGIESFVDCNTLAGNGSGSATINGGSIVGPDLNQQGPVDPNTTTLTAIADGPKTLTYSWDYVSTDTISARFDPAGYIVNG